MKEISLFFTQKNQTKNFIPFKPRISLVEIHSKNIHLLAKQILLKDYYAFDGVRRTGTMAGKTKIVSLLIWNLYSRKRRQKKKCRNVHNQII